jgi:IS30 family transposase
MKYRRMDYLDRIKLEEGIEQGRSQKWMARRLNFHPSTICREISRNHKSSALKKYNALKAYYLAGDRQRWRREPRNHRPRKCLDWKSPYEIFFRKTVALCS